MALSPKDIIPFSMQEVQDLESYIDSVLKATRTMESRIIVKLRTNYCDSTRKEIVRRYLVVGWKSITFKDYYGSQWDPCDDHTIEFTR